jgi:hypothetical protein
MSRVHVQVLDNDISLGYDPTQFSCIPRHTVATIIAVISKINSNKLNLIVQKLLILQGYEETL